MARWLGSGEVRALRVALVERDGLTCHWCHIQLELPPSGVSALEGHHATIDHVRPRSRGGSNALSNLVLACYECNQKRSKSSGSAGPLTEQQLAQLMCDEWERERPAHDDPRPMAAVINDDVGY